MPPREPQRSSGRTWVLFVICLILIGAIGGFGTYSFYAQNETARQTIARMETQIGDLSKSVQVSEDQKNLLQEQIEKLKCKTFWRANACTPESEMASFSAQPSSGTSPLKVKFTIKAPGLGYTVDFGDSSSTPLTIAQNADGGCTQGADGLCTVVLQHTYTATANTSFAAQIKKDDAVVTETKIDVRVK